MSEMTAVPILVVPLATSAAAPGPLPAAHAKTGMEQAAAATPGAAKAAGDRTDGSGAAQAAGGDSFASVLGRELAKDSADPRDLPTITPLSLAATPTDVAAAAAVPDDRKTQDKPAGSEDGTAAGIAALLPLLQSLLAGAAGPGLEAGSDASNDANIDAQIGPTLIGNSDARKALKIDANGAAMQEAAGQAAAAGDEPDATIPSKPGESNAAQPQAALGARESSASKGSAAIPAASPALDTKLAASHSESAAAPEASFASLLAGAQATAAQGRASHAALPLAVEAPVGSRNWDSNVGEKLVWMVGHHEQHADLVLNPPQLGRVEVSISVNGDQTNAQFVSANPSVRDALEAAIPRLREMLADAGLNLGQAQVGSGSAQNASGNPANNRENGDNSPRGSSSAGQVGALGQGGAGGAWLRSGKGMVDVFA